MHCGWHQVAFERDVPEGVSPIAGLDPPLALVRRGNSIRVIHATCPHRGANLGCGGTLEESGIRCPFHGLLIELGASSSDSLHVEPLDTLVVGGLVLAKESSEPDLGLTQRLRELDETCYIVPGFEMPVDVNAEMIVENAFDAAHFNPVHGVLNHPHFEISETQPGALQATGEFELPPSHWRKDQDGASLAPFEAIAYGPHVVVSTTGGHRPYTTITSSVPMGEHSCLVRLSVAIPADSGKPSNEECLFLLRQSRAGLEKDQLIWETLNPDVEPHFTAQDAGVIAFRQFCARWQKVVP